jgi:type II secretory ATPase GspE/PulE/Tfp pilus assembly ATPase PilB-like protein
VRRICPDSGKKLPIEGSLKMMIDHEFKDLPDQVRSLIPQADHVLEAEPSDTCPSGTRGRVAVMEMLEVNDEIERLILKSASEEELYKAARNNGFMSMKEDAIFKALEHVIPFEEIHTLGNAILEADADEAVDKSTLSPAPEPV